MKHYPNLRDVERQSGITWHELVELEPRLAKLLWESRRACGTCRRWSDVDRVFSPIRGTLAELVGFARNSRWHPVLVSPGAYQVAYWKLYDAVAGLLPCQAGSADEILETQQTEMLVKSYPAESQATGTVRV